MAGVVLTSFLFSASAAFASDSGRGSGGGAIPNANRFTRANPIAHFSRLLFIGRRRRLERAAFRPSLRWRPARESRAPRLPDKVFSPVATRVIAFSTGRPTDKRPKLLTSSSEELAVHGQVKVDEIRQVGDQLAFTTFSRNSNDDASNSNYPSHSIGQ